jgi:GAF domain-containing protein
MRGILKEPIQQKVILLITIFFAAFLGIAVVDTVLTNLSQNYQTAFENQLARRSLGKVVLRKLLSIERDYYRLASTDDRRDLAVLEKDVTSSLQDIQAVLDVLRDGGTFEDVLPTNFEDVDEIRERISFSLDKSEGYVIEVIDLTPKMLDIEATITKLFQAVNEKFDASNESERLAAAKDISLLLKLADSFLLRSRESADKIIYDTNLEIERLEQTRADSTRLFNLIRYAIIAIVGVTGIIIFVVTVSQINSILEERGAYAGDLYEANRELQTIRASLEQRVLDRTRDLELRSAQLQAAAEIGRTAASVRDSAELMPKVTRLIRERFGFGRVDIFLRHESDGQIALSATSSQNGQKMLDQEYKLEAGEEDLVRQVIRTKEPRIAVSDIALPLIAGDRLLGVLNLHSTAEHYTQEDMTVFEVLADQVAVAMENANLFTQSQEALEAERRAYGQISRQAWSQIITTRSGLRYLSNAQGTVALADDSIQPEMLQAVQYGQIVQSDRSTLVVPIRIREQTLGAIRLNKPDGVDEWTTEEIETLETLTEQLSLALESARLYQDTQQRAAREQMVGQVTARVRETLDMETVLRTAADEMRQALGLDKIVVRLATDQAEGDSK